MGVPLEDSSKPWKKITLGLLSKSTDTSAPKVEYVVTDGEVVTLPLDNLIFQYKCDYLMFDDHKILLRGSKMYDGIALTGEDDQRIDKVFSGFGANKLPVIKFLTPEVNLTNFGISLSFNTSIFENTKLFPKDTDVVFNFKVNTIYSGS